MHKMLNHPDFDRHWTPQVYLSHLPCSIFQRTHPQPILCVHFIYLFCFVLLSLHCRGSIWQRALISSTGSPTWQHCDQHLHNPSRSQAIFKWLQVLMLATRDYSSCISCSKEWILLEHWQEFLLTICGHILVMRCCSMKRLCSILPMTFLSVCTQSTWRAWCIRCSMSFLFGIILY